MEITAWPGSYDATAEDDVSFVRAYVDAGATRIITFPRIAQPDQLAAVRDTITRYADDVVAKL